jgi:hypothetical protein
MSEEGTAAPAEPRRRLRRSLVTVLIVLTSLSVVVTTVAWWAHSILFDTDHYVATVGPLIRDDEVVDALSLKLTDAVMDGLQIQQRIESTLQRVPDDRLPVSPELLAAPIANGVRNLLQKRFTTFLQRPAVQELWMRANRFAHDQVVSLLRGESETATIQGNTVYLDLLPLVNDLLSEVEDLLSDVFDRTIDIPEATGERAEEVIPALEQRFGIDLPDDFGKIPVFESDQLAAAQRAVEIADRLVIVLLVLTILLMIVTVALSVRRLRTVMWLGVGSAIGLIAARRITIRVQEDIVSLARGETNRGAVRDVAGSILGDLRSFTVWLLVLGIVVAVAAYLAGRPPWFGRLLDRAGTGKRRIAASGPTTRWVGAHADALKVLVAALGVLLLLTVNVSWWGLFLIVAIGLVLVLVLDQLKPEAAPASVVDPPV